MEERIKDINRIIIGNLKDCDLWIEEDRKKLMIKILFELKDVTYIEVNREISDLMLFIEKKTI